MLGAAFAAYVGCGNFLALEESPEAGAEAAASEDAAADAAGEADAADAADAATGCDPRGMFGAPELVPGLNTASGEYGARLTRDELTAYFTSARPGAGNYDIYVATRPTLGAAFVAPALVALVSTADVESNPSLSPDGLELFFEHAPVAGTFDVLVARRAAKDAGFASPVLVAEVNNAGVSESDPFVAQNGDLYFSSDRRAPTALDIFRAPRMADGGFGPPEPIEEVSTAANDRLAVLSFDMLTMYFTSSRTDQGGESAGDIWVARRTSLLLPFGGVTRLAELSAAGAFDSPSWLSADSCRLYMSSTRAGLFQIYVATRPR